MVTLKFPPPPSFIGGHFGCRSHSELEETKFSWFLERRKLMGFWVE
jgi:hypothetical protein